MSRLSKEARRRIYERGVALIENYKHRGRRSYGLCVGLAKAINEEYEEEGIKEEGGGYTYLDENLKDFPELVVEVTVKLEEDESLNGRYWWHNDEERLTALQNAIKTLDNENN